MIAGRICDENVFSGEVYSTVKCIKTSTFCCLVTLKCVVSSKFKTALVCRDTSTGVFCWIVLVVAPFKKINCTAIPGVDSSSSSYCMVCHYGAGSKKVQNTFCNIYTTTSIVSLITSENAGVNEFKGAVVSVNPTTFSNLLLSVIRTLLQRACSPLPVVAVFDLKVLLPFRLAVAAYE